MATRTLLRKLTLPYEAVKTVYAGDSEVRLYRNEITGAPQVGKRFDTLGLEEAVAVREATLLKTIRHPNVVPVDDVVRVEGYQQPMNVIELIMPYYPRGSVFDCFERGERFSIGRAVGMTVMTLQGLRELHEVHGILHRDMKSPNVFLTEDGGALVGDLGVAVPLDEDGKAEPLDSPRIWAPPETYTEEVVDVRSDIYQTGLLLQELTSGPFRYAATPDYFLDRIAERLHQGRRGVVNRDLAFAPEVPRRVRRIVNKAAAIRPGDRFASAREMADALRRAPLVDWTLIVDDPDRKVWQGTTPQQPDRDFRVEAERRKRDGAWRLKGSQRVTAWRRVVEDVISPTLDDRAARLFFDRMVDIATSR